MVREPDYTGAVPAPGNTSEATRPEEFEETDDELVILVIRTAKALVDRLRAGRADGATSPLTAVHGLAARYLVGRDTVTTVELARYLGITKQSTSEVVAGLERTGTVRRAPHPSDGRARVILLTDAGAAKLEDGRRRWHGIENEWAELVGRDRLDVMRDVLEAYLAADADAREERSSRSALVKG